ncbi:MAG: hypothetical protein JWP72_1481, partial [Massilia sp.]|nr:hypothetical protein [Massilia sp.]
MGGPFSIGAALAAIVIMCGFTLGNLLMDTSKLSRYPASRAFWFLFGMGLGSMGLWNGMQRDLIGETLCGVGLVLLGIQGLLRPVVLSRVARISKEEMTRDVSIGSDVLHGALSLAMA